jgi:heparin binding hemagglutinin HbhA
MARTKSTSTPNRIDPTRPFFAAVGGVDIAVAYARTGISEAQSRLAKVDFEPKALVGGLQKEAKAVPSRVVSEITETVDDLGKQYVDLADRGRTLVGRIRRQQATQDLKTEARSTVSRARTTTTQAGRTATKATDTAKKSAKAGATRTKSSAKATGTTAKKTATAAKKATTAAAAKTGTQGTDVKLDTKPSS